MRYRRGRSRGQAMVEFALVLPILVLMIGGIVEFGHIYSTNEAVINAARDGARYASLHPSSNSNSASPPTTTIQGQVMNAGVPGSLNPTILVCYYYSSSSSTATTNIQCPNKGSSAPLCGWYSPSAGTIIDATNTDVTATCATIGNAVDVQVTYAIHPLTGLVQALLPSGVQSSTDAMMVIECNPSGC